uniref:Uncharacterized protein n=1 Tax=Macrostomum lignano TaxID=282301 RepID=A0A1I8FN23_9PLAT
MKVLKPRVRQLQTQKLSPSQRNFSSAGRLSLEWTPAAVLTRCKGSCSVCALPLLFILCPANGCAQL